jgi:arabinan endo-1,5-alpha-L-arabinosidase
MIQAPRFVSGRVRPLTARGLAVGGLLCLALAGASPGQVLEDGRPVPAGDPTLFFADGFYYVFSSGPGAPIFRSSDLATWRPAGRVFAQLPDWAQADVPGSGGSCWAPDIVRIGDEFRVYWSTSTPGSRRSVIGFASNRTLDPASPDYRWVDRGKVIGTTPQDDWNAIDPQCFVDEEGRVWLALGSYWSGIKLRRLDAATGLLSKEDPTLYSLAARPGVEPPSIEGAYLLRHGGFYHLFVSFDRCHRNIHSDYNVRVGRSRKVTGPYLDREGRALLQGGGTLVLASYGAVRGPGHNSVLEQGGRTWLAHHYFDPASGGRRVLQVRPLFWDENDWPLVGEPVAPRTSQAAAHPPAGRWNYSIDFGQPMAITLRADGSIAEPSVWGTWKIEEDRLVLVWKRSGEARDAPLVERCFFSGEGGWFVGRNAYGQIVRGWKPPD